MKLCHFCRARLGEFLDETLSASDREKVAAHLATCPDCAREKRELELTMATLRDLKPVAAPPELRLKVRAALQDERAAQRSGRDALDFRWWRPARMALTGSVTLAAMLLIVLAKPFSNPPQFVPESGVSAPAQEDRAVSEAPQSKSAGAVVPKSPPAAQKAPLGNASKKSVVNAAPSRATSTVTKASAPAKTAAKIAKSPAPAQRVMPALSPPVVTPLPALPSVPSGGVGGPRETFVNPSPLADAAPPVEGVKRAKLAPAPEMAAKSSIPVFTPPQPEDAPLPSTKPSLRFRSAEPVPAPMGAFDATSVNGADAGPDVAAKPGFTAEIATANEPRADLLPRRGNSMGGRAASSVAAPVSPPAVADSLDGIKSFARPKAAMAPPLAKTPGNAQNADNDEARRNRLSALESRPAPVPQLAPPALPATAPSLTVVPIVPNQRHYRLNVTPSRDLKNGQITLILPPSLRFGASDANNSLIVWRGDASQGKKIEINVTLTGAQGGEKISVQLEQNGAKAESETAETQSLTLPASN